MISCITYADKKVDNVVQLGYIFVTCAVKIVSQLSNTNGATNNYNLIKLSIYF